MWGIKGIIDWFRRLLYVHKQQRFFRKNAERFPFDKPEKGITIIGFLSGGGWSLSKVLRDFAFALRDANIPFQTFDTGDCSIPGTDIEGIITKREDFRIGKYTNVVEFVSSVLPDGIVEKRDRIVFWEFSEGAGHAFHPLLERDDGIIAMSNFNYGYFKREFGNRLRVSKVLYPLRIDVSNVSPQYECRACFGIPKDDFVIFGNFAYTSGWFRKNPIGTVRAFARAFREVPNTRLVFKTAGRDAFLERERELKAVAAEEGVLEKILFFDDWLSHKALYNLSNACDVFVSLHRAEGFGLAIAEAMVLSKPVIVTDYSGSTEFCNETNSIPIPYKLVDIPDCQKDAVWYRDVKHWAEPDIDTAAAALRNLYSDADLRLRLGVSARNFIAEKYSTDAFRNSIYAFLGG